MKDFLIHVFPSRERFIVVKTIYAEVNRIESIVLNTLNLNSLNELRDKYEGVAFYNEFSREIYGTIAVEKLLKLNLINWSIINAKSYKADMNHAGFNVDIITCKYGELPVIEKNIKRSAIITVKKDEKSVWICGFASIKVLQDNQNNHFIKETIYRDSKTAFVGFDKLKSFTTIEELKNLMQESSKLKTIK